jgi:hypothetical protein
MPHVARVTELPPGMDSNARKVFVQLVPLQILLSVVEADSTAAHMPLLTNNALQWRQREYQDTMLIAYRAHLLATKFGKTEATLRELLGSRVSHQLMDNRKLHLPADGFKSIHTLPHQLKAETFKAHVAKCTCGPGEPWVVVGTGADGFLVFQSTPEVHLPQVLSPFTAHTSTKQRQYKENVTAFDVQKEMDKDVYAPDVAHAYVYITDQDISKEDLRILGDTRPNLIVIPRSELHTFYGPLNAILEIVRS